ncbi:hypothetical protein BDQ17DRAFT_1389154 [Cyathus striatus]|nr:hypothetical protein BDQ17DRAFT_1389154 [Cyathus striatus]
MESQKAAKKRKLTDKSIPNAISQNPTFAEDSQMYQSLIEMERKLDWNMTRKRLEVQDALGRNLFVRIFIVDTTTRTLRIFISHTVSGQLWQSNGEPPAANFETGEGIPAWSLRIEGRLLEPPSRSRDKVTPRKFSTLIKRMIVELERDPTVYPDGNIIEWPRTAGPHNPPLDGFTIRRTGDVPTKVRVVMYLEHFPEQYKVLPELANVLGIKEESRIGVIQTLWNYIKLNNLQDKTDRRLIRADDKLRLVFGAENVKFHDIPQIANRFLAVPDPIVLHYTVNPTIPPPERPSAWDVEIKTEDTSMKNRMTALVQTSKESSQQMVKLDEEIALLAQSLHNSHLKRTFLESFANDPTGFIQTWLESQSRDLETILGSGPTEGATVRQEELKRSEFFQLPWVEEWAGEVISLRDKSAATEEFKELEKDIEMRKVGAERMFMASEGFYSSLSKKKINLAFNDTDKLLPIDTLGVIMIIHGEEYGEESPFGTAMVQLGRAHCQVATLQEAFALTFKDTFISSIERLSEEIKGYEAVRKKLESKRLSYDAAANKYEKLKNSKKEKDKREAEDEMEKAKQRYDETAEDLRAHMEVIQEYETTQMRDLGSGMNIPERRKDIPSRTLSTKRSKEVKPGSLRSRAGSRAESRVTVDSSDEEGTPSRARRMSLHQRRDSAASSKVPSRPTSRSSRKRTDSSATAGGAEEDKDTSDTSKPKKISVTGWASNAVESIRKKNRDVDLFTEIGGGGGDANSHSEYDSSPKKTRNLPFKYRPNASPKPPPRPLQLVVQSEKKIVRALHDFNGSSDELSFRAGNEIVVIQEVLDEWWMGELDGRRGLFPANYVEAVPLNSKRPVPMPSHPSNITITRPPLKDDYDNHSVSEEGYGTSDIEEEREFSAQPLAHQRSPFYASFGDTMSITSTEEEKSVPVPSVRRQSPILEHTAYHSQPSTPPRSNGRLDPSHPDIAQQPLIRRTASESYPNTKKVPPPPPPRRASNAPTPVPPIPDRRPNGAFKTNTYTSSVSSMSNHGYDTSPFDSALDLSAAPANECTQFKQNPFKPKGMCSNCFQFH